ncbi:chromosomal replication initiator protein DnaA [Tindallia californiensis]|uniref:Chromosomal replication initiator protein DnaA n=1 Tax=Tindallia californiensis TaxID=159292 RepID=A0A1H3PU71_9FIRM|nr:chromosomal replication initiator protein DnaA [Tindallia californiensis]SDZ04491.1 chromosomal replication initiator protein DnaA [Tindallia californiensis]
MDQQLSQIWDETLSVIEQEVTGVSFDTWIKVIEPLRVQDDANQIIFRAPNQFIKNILSDRYLILIKNAIKEVTSCSYDVVFQLPDEVKTVDSTTLVTNTEEEKTGNNQSSTEKTQTATTIQTANNNLNPKYIFDTFVVGNSNRFAHAASVAVSEAPAKAYNPLFIYGGVGLGKTHLMHAIGHHILQSNKQMKVFYSSSETFTNELINSIRDDKNIEFRNKYRNVDVLLIDDIQFIANKERTQEEFFHTFNALHQYNKQIIISSDRPPKEIPTLEERLRSRFEWGLIADIQPPDYETRIAILRKKAHLEQLNVSDDVLLFIAKKIQSNIRELEGALNRIVVHCKLNNNELNIDTASRIINEVFTTQSKQINVGFIKEYISNQYSIKAEDLDSTKRTRSIAFPRQIAMYLTRELTDLSLPKIGKEFGNRDHTTVMHAHDKIVKEMEKDDRLKQRVEEMLREIKGGD